MLYIIFRSYSLQLYPEYESHRVLEYVLKRSPSYEVRKLIFEHCSAQIQVFVVHYLASRTEYHKGLWRLGKGLTYVSNAFALIKKKLTLLSVSLNSSDS